MSDIRPTDALKIEPKNPTPWTLSDHESGVIIFDRDGNPTSVARTREAAVRIVEAMNREEA